MKLQVFDFDGTLIEGDSLKHYCRWVSKSKIEFLLLYHLILRIYFLIIGKNLKSSRITYFLGLAKKRNLNFNEFKNYLKEFLFSDSILLISQGEGIKIVVSASFFEIIGEFVKEYLNCEIVTNQLLEKGKDINGEEKVRQIEKRYPNSEIEIAYGNSNGDIPMMRVAKKAFWRHKNGKLEEWKS